MLVLIHSHQSYIGTHGGIIALHGGSYIIGNVGFVTKFYSNIAEKARIPERLKLLVILYLQYFL